MYPDHEEMQNRLTSCRLEVFIHGEAGCVWVRQAHENSHESDHLSPEAQGSRVGVDGHRVDPRHALLNRDHEELQPATHVRPLHRDA